MQGSNWQALILPEEIAPPTFLPLPLSRGLKPPPTCQRRRRRTRHVFRRQRTFPKFNMVHLKMAQNGLGDSRTWKPAFLGSMLNFREVPRQGHDHQSTSFLPKNCQSLRDLEKIAKVMSSTWGQRSWEPKVPPPRPPPPKK